VELRHASPVAQNSQRRGFLPEIPPVDSAIAAVRGQAVKEIKTGYAK
jgi:hypothetical protein